MLQVIGYPTLDEGLEYLQKYVSLAEERGERVIVFCEDRLTLLAEKSVCRARGGSFLTSVTSFARFLRFDGRTLSKQGSVMAVAKLMAENADKLQCLSCRGGAKNGAAAVYEMLSQLAASCVTGDMLLDALPDDGLLCNKLHDLALLYDAYNDFLRCGGYIDENGYLALLPDAIRNNGQLRGANVVFFGFVSFTEQALDGVRAACETAKNVLGLLPAGSAELYSRQAATALKTVCLEYGDVKIAQLKIPDERAGMSEVLREKLYDPQVFSHAYTPRESGGRVRIRQVNDEEEELRFVCARVKKHVAQGGKYADVVVFVPDVKKYSLLLAKCFGEFAIPYFIDLKKPLAAHPFAGFLLSVLRAAADGGTPDSVEQIASSCYFGDDGSYRNYLAKFCNYRGGAKRAIKEGDLLKDYDRDYLLSMRERLIAGMGVFSRQMKGKQFCQGVRCLYDMFEAEKVTKALVERCDDDMQREYLERLPRALDGILSEAEAMLGDVTMMAVEFSALLQDGLTACEVSLLPLKCDEVFVGDVTQSRVQAGKLVFALGMTDEVPMQGEDTALLSDKEMQRLEEVRVKIEPSMAQVNARARENVCLNVCSFTGQLYLLYPSHTEEERAESDILRYVRRIFSDTDQPEDLFLYACSAPMPALKELLFHKEAYQEGREESRREYASLYDALQSREEVKSAAKLLFEGSMPTFFVPNGEKLFFAGGDVSPTLLETYYTCPYNNFSAKGLRLKEREEAAVMATDTGIFVHEILEKTAKNIDALPDEESCLSFARARAEELIRTPAYASSYDTKAGQYSAERLVQESAQVALEMYCQIKNSNFHVARTEYECSLPDIEMRGKIDRVDECGDYIRIIDYKTGSIDDAPKSYYVGTKLQLQLYMSSVSAGKIPAGTYYFPASIHYAREDEEPFRMQGFMNGSEEVVKNSDPTLQEGETSRYFNATLGKFSEKVLSEEDFRRFIDYSVLLARQGSKELKRGFIAPTPYDGACRYCPYKGMCASLGDEAVRKVPGRIGGKNIADIVRRTTEPKGGE